MADEREPIDELLGAYALDAVDDHERRQVEAYLERWTAQGRCPADDPPGQSLEQFTQRRQGDESS